MKPSVKQLFTLRELTLADVEECVNFYSQMVEHHRAIYEDGRIPYGDEQRRNLKEKLERTDSSCIKMVAERKKQVVGLIMLEVKGATLEIADILVDKKMRRKGIGRAFMRFTKKTALKRKCREIKVNFAARNLQALEFYHKAGLNCLGMIEIFMPLTETGREQWYEKGKKTRFLGFNCYY